ncbi:MAG: fibronectin type III domain-containing protein, partial [Acidobacteriota bacterium]|nr:fibronectin type III domain-containing protein [Acidobacteriota bacterium]
MRGHRLAVVCLAAAALLAAAGCGKKGPLQPPLRIVPQPAESLRASQRGARVILEWTNPEAYNDGALLAGIASVEVWEGSAPGDFPTAARLVRALSAADLEPLRTVPGPKSRTFAFSFVPAVPASFSGPKRLFALRIVDAKRKRASEFSPPAGLSYVPVPQPPSGLTAEVGEARIVLRWTAPAANVDGSAPPALGGYIVLRADGDEPARRLNEQPVAETRYEDADFVFGRAYRYIVRAAAAAEAAAESEDAAPCDVTPRDVFPPAVPSGLSAAAGSAVITLLWDAGRESDLAGYKVWRREDGGEWILLTAAPIAGRAYTDAAPAKGVRCEYAISAVDADGNESARCAPVAETIKESADDQRPDRRKPA